MPTEHVQLQRTPVDMRIIVYRTMKQLLVILATGIAVKLFIADSVLIKTNQMSPAIINGDRVLVWKACCASPLKFLLPLRRHTTVIFNHTHGMPGHGCLRIAGKHGDVISISNGSLSVLNEPRVTPLGNMDSASSLPAEYSPRDWFDPYTVPKPGEVLNLDTLPLRELLFAWAVIRQENPVGKYTLQSWLHVNDSLISDYYITDFSLYRGPLNAVPLDLSAQWFFWDKLLNYIQAANPDKKIELKLSILRKGSTVMNYRVKKSCFFLIADSWREGFDSRYLGPVSESSVKGSVACVLWSFDPTKKFPLGFRIERTCRIVR
jgi:signal peptidase I